MGGVEQAREQLVDVREEEPDVDQGCRSIRCARSLPTVALAVSHSN